jgi:hypothetical protein
MSGVRFGGGGGGQIGLANATNTNTDTSARVHTTARVCIHLYNSLADPNIVTNNLPEFRAIKEEIALGLGRPFNPMGVSYSDQHGLAPVFTNTTVINTGKQDDLMRWYIRFFDSRNRADRVAQCAQPCVVKGQSYYPSELYFAGIVMSDGEADPTYGDTAVTLMIGGKITVRNGGFAVQTGDKMHWYFEEEKEADMFDEQGLRHPRRAIVVNQPPPAGVGTGTTTMSALRPIEYVKLTDPHQQRIRDFTYAERALLKRPAFIKPCLIGLDGKGATRSDMARVVGIACSNAGPYERVDIKLCRQSF